MALYHKWDVKTGFTFALKFFMLISDSLGGVVSKLKSPLQICIICKLRLTNKFANVAEEILRNLRNWICSDL